MNLLLSKVILTNTKSCLMLALKYDMRTTNGNTLASYMQIANCNTQESHVYIHENDLKQRFLNHIYTYYCVRLL